jgi:hypothetical protein
MLDIGNLVQISQTFLESFVNLKGLLTDVFKRSGGSVADADKIMLELREKVDAFQSRLQGLATQLEQSERLTRMIPAWEAYANQIPVYKQISEILPDEAQRIHYALRDWINASINDQFSSTFFRAQFDSLPGMEAKLEIFRANLRNVDRTVSTIPAGNFEVFKVLWSQITVEFNNVRNSGYEVRRHAEEIHGRLIEELLRSTQEAKKFLAQM